MNGGGGVGTQEMDASHRQEHGQAVSLLWKKHTSITKYEPTKMHSQCGDGLH